MADDPADKNPMYGEEDDVYLHPSNVYDVRSNSSVSLEDGFIEQILDIKEWMKSPWVEDEFENDD